MKAYSNWQNAQQTLTKKREALVKLELAGKNEKLPQAQDEVKEVSHILFSLIMCFYLSNYDDLRMSRIR